MTAAHFDSTEGLASLLASLIVIVSGTATTFYLLFGTLAPEPSLWIILYLPVVVLTAPIFGFIWLLILATLIDTLVDMATFVRRVLRI